MPMPDETRQKSFWQILSAENGLFMGDLTKRGGCDLLFLVAA
jgi:hypothetical protein